MSTGLASGKIEFTKHREIAHVRQDLSVTKEILAIVKDENERLRSIVEDHALEVSRLNEDLEDSRRTFFAQKHTLEAEITRLKSNRISLEEELTEALAERKRLSELLRSVRGQVDGRLTKLVEELQRKDETIHKLEYQNREFEREIDRLNRVVKTDVDISKELEKTQENYVKASTEISLLKEQINHYQIELLKLQEKSNQITDNSNDNVQIARLREVVSLLPLYRQWLLELGLSLREIEDNLEISLTDGIDSLAQITSPGIPYRPPIIERQRLAEMKKFERDSMRNEKTKYHDMCESYEETLALSVHLIRESWDSSRHSLEKVKVLSKQLSENMKSVLKVSEDMHIKTVSLSQPEVSKTTIDSSIDLEQRPFFDIIKQSFELQLQSRDEELRKKEDKIINLERIISSLEVQKDSLNNEIFKTKQDAMNASFISSSKLTDMEYKLQEALKSSEELFSKKLADVKLEYEKEIKDIKDTKLKLINELETEKVNVENMKKLLIESKNRRQLLKEENTSVKKQLQGTEDVLNSLRVELLGAKRTIELLHAELQFSEKNENLPTPLAASNAFRTFKKEMQRSSMDTKTIFLPRSL